MRRFLTVFCILAILFSLAVLPLQAEETGAKKEPSLPEPASESVLLMDADTGSVLFQKNGTAGRNPASIAKIVTVLLGIESGKGDETVTVSEEIVNRTEKDSTHISLVPGEEVRLTDLFYAAMMASAHDAANAIAEGISGSVDAFVEQMNLRMKSAGATGTRFTNADGSRDADNCTTAQDMALITREALKNDTFREIFGTVSYTMPATNKNASTRSFTTLCLLLKDNDKNARYEDAVGGKTGWDEDAQYTMVSAAKRKDQTLICVVLGAHSSQERYDDTIALFEYGFQAFRNVTVPTTLIPKTEIPVMKDGVMTAKAIVSIPEGTLLSTKESFEEGTMVVTSDLPSYLTEDDGFVRLTISAKDATGTSVVLGTVILDVVSEKLNVDLPGGEKTVEKSVGAKIWDVIKKILLILLIIVGIVLCLALILFGVSYAQRQKRKKLRRRRQEERRRREEEEQAPKYVGKRFRKQGAEPDPDAETDKTE